ncbi:hypothetical protein [Streptomyces triticirhizae]|uniref:hypothetical protein n=1 Tax=Streptomyces triticirhizae TaxID=2483353 RepID=UPI0018F57931|nr:hypothetical protein [Streptomyces triticirhizae]
MASARTTRTPMPPLRRRIGPILGLLLLSPICAEYLIGYLEVMGDPVELLGGLLILAPLYGTAAVMIREVIRGTGRGWLSILLLSAAFGVIQAGLVDQSLFNPDYGLAVLVIFHEHTRDFMASPAQLGAAAAVAVALATAAFLVPRRRAPRRAGWVPAPWLAGGVAMALMTVHHLLPPSRPGTVLDLLTLVLLGGLVVRWSRRAGWGRGHVLAVGGAALVANAALSFMVEPLGEVSYTAKYAANAVLMLGVLALLLWARRRLSETGPERDGLDCRADTAVRGSLSQPVAD